MAPQRPSRRSSRPASPTGRTTSAVASPRISSQTTIDEVPPTGQTSLDAWLEPPLRSSTAYEDAGMEKSAIFENMQPLGTQPNVAKLKYKPFIRSTNEKRQILKPWGDNTVSTPELTPPVEVQSVEREKSVDLPSSITESVEKEAFPLLNGAHTEEPGIETPPLAHDAPSLATLSPQPLEQKEVTVVPVVHTPTFETQELPLVQTSTPQQLPATQNGIINEPFPTTSPVKIELSDKALAAAIYDANRRAQEAGDEVQGEALIALFKQAREPGQEELYEAIKAHLCQTPTPEQIQLFGLKFKHQRAITKRRLRTKSVNTRPSSISSIQYMHSPETRQSSLPLQITAPMISTITTAPINSIIGQNVSITSNPPNPPMGSFQTTPLRATAKVSLIRTPHKDAPTKATLSAPSTPVLQPSPKIRSRNNSNATVTNSPAVLGKRRRPNKETEVAVSDAPEDSTPQAKRRATILANKEIAIKEAVATQFDGPKVNGTATRMTRSRKSMIDAPPSSPKPTVPQTPPTRTRSGKRRQSSSDLSSVDEEVVNDGPPAPAPVPKRSAAEAYLDERTEQTRLRRARYDAQLSEHKFEWQNLPRDSSIRPSPQPQKEQTLKINVASNRSTRSGVRRPIGRDESAPLTPAFPSPRDGLFPTASRATRSSQQFSNAEPLVANKPKVGARFKTSPIKDRVTAAGVSRNNGYGGSPPSRQASPSRGGNDEGAKSKDDDEHSDQCHACGEEGKLICCDNCPNALHYRCCDPPIKGPAEYKNRAFYCQECKKQDQGEIEEADNSNTSFRPLFARLLTTNTSSFQLPKAIQRYFAGVTAKDNGEYSDDTKKVVTTNRRNGVGWEVTDGTRERDQPRLMRCIACNQTSLDGRSIIQCDECNTQWHTDCLSPPLANPPPVNNINRTRAFFRCPRHIDQDMRMFGTARLDFAEPSGHGERGHKIRKLRKARIIKPLIQRGNKNNGFIEVEFEDEEEAVQEDEVIYKLNAKAIQMDFLEKAYAERERNEKCAARRAIKEAARAAPPPVDIEAEIQKRMQEKSSADIEAEIQRRVREQSSADIEAEIQRRVEEQVHQRLRDHKTGDLSVELAFVKATPAEQTAVASLVGLCREERLRVDQDNLSVLSMAVKQAAYVAGS